MSFIECAGLGHRYESALGQSNQALSAVSLSIQAGEFVCLLGPSGCGKTTLLNLLAGFLSPSEGQLSVGGLPVRGPSPQRGVVFQDYSLFPWLTVADNVAFGLRMKGLSAAQCSTVVASHLALVGLESAARRYPFELSGGMKQRVAIARALAPDPDVLLMDEPFAALDAMTRGSLQEQLLQIHESQGKTVVFVTHNIGEAILLGTRILVLSPNPGRVVEDLKVDLPRPRRRTSTQFNALYEHLTELIGFETVD
ncbi:ABC transporter ATP-binding protein [Lacisediminimonas profundi]|uniref:ABC transporter ATP-binding protein n=1 Tax=Lacisediminimonas profundi TaxID=2603856 RepID=UPI001883360B|nr:ABC transporter ATP-binding protein [Lacisediminimonas profundi]